MELLEAIKTRRSIRDFTGQPIPVRKAKQIVAKAMEINMQEGNRMMEEACIACFKTEDLQEGVKAVFEKRAPQFKGK